VPPVIGLPTRWKICQIIWVGISNEIVLDFIEFVFIIFIFVFILVDFGFDIEELIAAFTSALSAMALLEVLDTVA
jgi:hypothetical protein